MSEENKGYDFTGLSADEDFDSFLESIRRDLGEAPSPRAASRPGPAVPPEPAEPEPEPVGPEPAEPEPEPRPVRKPRSARPAESMQQPEPKRERSAPPKRRDAEPRPAAKAAPARERSARPEPQPPQKSARRSAPDIKWGPPPEEQGGRRSRRAAQDEPPKRRSGFARALILYTVVLVVAAVAVMAVLWKYLEAYEFTRPENVMAQFEQMADEQYWETAVTSSFAVTPSEFETKSQLEDELCLSLLRDGTMTYVKDEAYTDAAPVYLVSVNGVELCRVYMSPQAGGEAGFGLQYMSINKVELLADFIAPKARSLTITAPVGATVTVNGIAVSESYLSDAAPDTSYLPELEQNAADLLCCYEIANIYGTVEIAGTAANGDTLVAEKSDENGAVFALPEGELSYTIYAPVGATVSVNGVELDENYKKTGEDTSLGLFEGLENYGTAPEMEAWEVGGLHQTPEITAANESGTALSAPYLQDGVYVFQPAADEELASSQQQYAETFYDLYAAFEANRDEKIDTNYYNILPYMYGGTPLGTRLASEYSSRQPSGGVAAGSYDSVEVTGFVPYGDNLYTCTVLLYNDDELAGSCAVAFIKAGGKWYAAATVEYAVE
ncbi:MAG: hypothetical protein ACOX7G_03910 [Candidatus Scatomorpha sp.]|jgi:hypothetical protein